MDGFDKVFVGTLLAIVVIIVGSMVLVFGNFLSHQGVKYEATITVTTVEISNRKYVHTYVWTDQVVSTGEGMESKQYFFADTPNFEVGKTYYVEWHDEIRFHPLDLWYIIGVVDYMEVVPQ